MASSIPSDTAAVTKPSVDNCSVLYNYFNKITAGGDGWGDSLNVYVIKAKRDFAWKVGSGYAVSVLLRIG